MNQKYELLQDDTIELCGLKLYRIRALVAIGALVSPGQLGGYIEAEKNLSVSGESWVSGDAYVSGNARVFGDARVSGDACVYGDARVYGDAHVCGNARVYGDAKVEKTHHYMNVIGQKFNLTFTPQNVAGGCRLFTHDEFADLTIKDCQTEWKEWELENYKAFQWLYIERLERLDGKE